MSENYVPEKKSNGVGLASLICGLVSFFGCCNPFYLVSLAAIILAIVALAQRGGGKGMAIAGLILGILAIMIWVVLDILLIPVTFGFSFFI